MYCNRIITRVEHWVGAKTRRDSFFVVEITWEDMSEALELLGKAYVDAHSMWRFLDWHSGRGEIKQVTFLVSLDSKYVVVGDRDNLQHVIDEEIVGAWPLNPEGDGVYGSVEGSFRAYLDRLVGREPEMAHILGYKPKKITLKNRISFAGSIVLEFNPVFFADIYDLDHATDANLALAYINPEITERHGQIIFDEIMIELQKRADHGWRFDESWFKPAGLSLPELEQRRIRAHDNLQKLDLLLFEATARALKNSGSLGDRFWAQDFELVAFLAKFKKFDEVIELYILAATHPDFEEGLREIVWELVCRLDDSEPMGAVDPEDF